MLTNNYLIELYEPPKVKVVKIEVERGFALSDDGDFSLNDQEPIQQTYFYTLKKVRNGGQAW